jgi:hypothetical protein
MGQLGNGNSGNSENGERCMHSRVGCGEEKILRVVWASNIVSIQNACQRNANARFTMEKNKVISLRNKGTFRSNMARPCCLVTARGGGYRSSQPNAKQTHAA